MDFVLDFPLILVVLSGGQSYANSNSCYPICPAGYSKVKDCDSQPRHHECKKCVNGTYTAIENTRQGCLRCDRCGRFEETICPCTSTRNVECGCRKGYFLEGKRPSGYCQRCDIPDTNPDYMKKCQPGKRNCAETPSTPTISPGNVTQNPFFNPVTVPIEGPRLWLPYLVVVGISVVLCGLLLLLLHLIRKKTEKPNMVLCCRTNIGVEPHADDAKSKEQGSDQGSSSTTLRFTISEETPMMALSPCPVSPRHPAAHTCPLLPNVEQEAVRQDEQSELWPAIVLYAIIKEVPLRRWKEFLRLLLVADQQLERVELEAGMGSMEKQYQMLRLWSQRSSASLSDVFSALHHMDLSGCAQLLQENLEKLKWTP